MTDSVYLVNPETKQTQAVEPVSFAQIGVKERSDLQEWILAHPKILGEELLVITSEFDRFDRSNNRLDILALDKNGVLTIVELKLDASRTLADLQALRYAAFCSTMTMDDLVMQLSRHAGISIDDAADTIMAFLSADELPELTAQPRIILGAGSINDVELTSTVLWLRKFGVDITCVEVTPYRLPNTDELMLVPRVLIPLPEAKEFIVTAERSDSTRIRKHQHDNRDSSALREVATAFNALSVSGFTAKAHKYYTVIFIPNTPWNIHYEFLRINNAFNFGLHAEFKDRAENFAALQPVFDQWDHIRETFGLPGTKGPLRRLAAQATLTFPTDSASAIDESAQQAAVAMRRFIELTYPLLGRTRISNVPAGEVRL